MMNQNIPNTLWKEIPTAAAINRQHQAYQLFRMRQSAVARLRKCVNTLRIC